MLHTFEFTKKYNYIHTIPGILEVTECDKSVYLPTGYKETKLPDVFQHFSSIHEIYDHPHLVSVNKNTLYRIEKTFFYGYRNTNYIFVYSDIKEIKDEIAYQTKTNHSAVEFHISNIEHIEKFNRIYDKFAKLFETIRSADTINIYKNFMNNGKLSLNDIKELNKIWKDTT